LKKSGKNSTESADQFTVQKDRSKQISEQVCQYGIKSG